MNMVGASVLPWTVKLKITTHSKSFCGCPLKENGAVKVLVGRPSIYVSTNPSDVNPDELLELYGRCKLSSHRFPNRDTAGHVGSIDVRKLGLALRHSSVVISVFSRSDAVSSLDTDNIIVTSGEKGDLLPKFLRKWMPPRPYNGQLVGFGRAVSDIGLTASIHDVMVVPSLRMMGIGHIIIRRILRILTSREVYDIAALCSKEERPFFEACGFGEDMLCSRTMMYTKSSTFKQNHM